MKLYLTFKKCNEQFFRDEQQKFCCMKNYAIKMLHEK